MAPLAHGGTHTRPVPRVPPRVSSPLAAVLPMHAVAALLGVNSRAFAKRVRAGAVVGATPTFDQTGYLFGWRVVDGLLGDALVGDELARARVHLLQLRAGAVRAEEGVFHPVTGAALGPCDAFTDEQLTELVVTAADELEGAIAGGHAFDEWAVAHGYAFHHRDVMVRLLVGDWGAVLALASIDLTTPDEDPSDPLAAMRSAALRLGGGNGRELTPARFDEWASRNGCQFRAAQLRQLYSGWNAAKAAAGLELNDHRTYATD